MKMKNVFLDIGNVLVINHPEWAAKKFSKINRLSVEDNMEIMGDHDDYMKGEITPAEFAQKFIQLKKLNISEQEFYKIYVDIYTLNEPLFNVLKDLKGKVKFTIISNAEEKTIEFLKKKFPELFSLFDGKFAFSFLKEVAAVKPDKKIYEYALKISGAKPEESVFFDDRIEYVKAARKLGIYAFLYTTVEEFIKDLKSLGIEI